MTNNRTVGFWIIMILGIFLTILLLVGQTGALISYKFTVSLGLQEAQYIIGALGVAINKGFAAADTIIYLPLLVIGLIGLWRRKTWGLFALASAFGITAYWPIISLLFLAFAKGTPGFYFTSYLSYSIMLIAIAIVALLGLIYICKKRQQLV